MKSALITGITGQDGSYLCDILLRREGYVVHGLVRRSSNSKHLQRINHNLPNDNLILHNGDITDIQSITSILTNYVIDEIYHMADQDHIGYSYDVPTDSWKVTVGGTSNVIEATGNYNKSNQITIFIPISATIFGKCSTELQTIEDPIIEPNSPYACAKAHVYHLVQMYEYIYQMNFRVAILYNHESPRRSGSYLLQKICRTLYNYKYKSGPKLELKGDLDTRVDIGYAPEYMEIVYELMQQDELKYITLGTGLGISIYQLAQYTCNILKLGYDDAVIHNKESYINPNLPKENLIANTKYCEQLGHIPKIHAYSIIERLLNPETDIHEEWLSYQD